LKGWRVERCWWLWRDCARPFDGVAWRELQADEPERATVAIVLNFANGMMHPLSLTLHARLVHQLDGQARRATPLDWHQSSAARLSLALSNAD